MQIFFWGVRARVVYRGPGGGRRLRLHVGVSAVWSRALVQYERVWEVRWSRLTDVGRVKACVCDAGHAGLRVLRRMCENGGS